MLNQQETRGAVFHPVWMLLSVTIPQGFLFLMTYNSFSVFVSLLSEEQIQLWRNFAISFLTLLGAVTLYGFWRLFKKRPVHVLISPLLIITYIPLLYVYIIHFEDLVDRRVPEWVASVTDLALLYPGTFLMPSFLYALAIGIVALTPSSKKSNSLLNFMGAAAIPLAWYGFFTLILPLFRNARFDNYQHVLSVLLIGSTVFFFFLLFRFFYLIIYRNKRDAMLFTRVWRIVFSLVLPLAGLIIYEYILPRMESMLSSEAHAIIGDFDHPLFLILTIINGLALCLPDFSVPKARRIVFGIRVLCFPFTLYFFFVFLPFLPLSLIAILFFGLGLLMLAPAFLFIVQVKILTHDFKFLMQESQGKKAVAIIVVAFLVLPLGITWSFMRDRSTLHQVLDYVFEEKQVIDINRDRLEKVLETLEQRSTHTPFISQYYKWLVLDNMQLSNSKLTKIRKIFFDEGEAIAPQRVTVDGDSSVTLDAVHYRTAWEEQSRTFRSSIELKIKNNSPFMAEFATSFKLPAGVWMSDYYLFIGDKKVPGKLREKKAALWIYQRIMERKKDPGLVYYLNENLLALHVFPLNSGEIRTTGFELIHKEPFSLNLEDKTLELGFRQAKNRNLEPHIFPFISPDGRTIFVSRESKKLLPRVRRKPYLHFVLDYSESCEASKSDYRNKIDRLVTEKKLDLDFAKVTFANYNAETMFLQDVTAKKLADYPCRGGFFLDKAIRSIVINQHRAMSLVYPIIIVISPNLENAVLPGLLDQLDFAVPETDFYYELTPEGRLNGHALVSDPVNHAFGKKKPQVRVWPAINNPKAFFSDDNNPGLALVPEKFVQSQSSETIDQWTKGLTLWGLTKQGVFDAEPKHVWKQLVFLSKQHRLLSTYTAFTVLENQAQWEVLKQKEKTALNAKESLDMGDSSQEFREMSEPPLMLVLAGLLIVTLLRRKLRLAQSD